MNNNIDLTLKGGAAFASTSANWTSFTRVYVRHKASYFKEIKYLMATLPKFIISFDIYKNNLQMTVHKEYIIRVLMFLRTHWAFQYRTLFDICCIDFLKRYPHRFQLIYGLLCYKHAKRIYAKVNLKEKESIWTSSVLFKSANWLEREVWDTFGVFFKQHPDLRRILTDYGFEGHPFRKDFPLSGYLEIRYDDSKKRVVYEPLELTQEYRNFDFTSPWFQYKK